MSVAVRFREDGRRREDGFYRSEWGKYLEAYQNARREHAVWLRKKGLKYKEIGELLGISPKRASLYIEQHQATEWTK